MIINKKILFLTTTDNMIWQFLLPHIKHLQDAGNTVECACAKTGFWFDEMKEKYGLVVHETSFSRSPYKVLKNRRAFKKLKGIVKGGGFDLIHCHQPVGGVMGRKVGAKCKVPVLYTAHGFHFFKGAPFKYNLIYKRVEKRWAKKTDALVTMNEEDYIAAKAFKAKRVYKISGSGYDVAKNKDFKFDKLALQKEIGVSEDDCVVVSIGECIKRKNLAVLIKAVKKIEDSKVKLLICGKGKLLEKHKKLVAKLGLGDRVKMLGYRKDVRNILKLADIFIMSSKHEGLPMGMMEAMYEGLPIIASNVRGCCDLVERGKNGLLVVLNTSEAYADAIGRIAANKELRAEMGKHSKEMVKQFFIGNVLKEMEVIYDELGLK